MAFTNQSLPVHWWLLRLLLPLALTPYCTSGKKIVFIPMSMTSHVRSHVSIAREMSTLGHQAWVAVPRSMEDKKTFSDKGISLLWYEDELKDLEMQMLTESNLLSNFWAGRKQDLAVMHKIGSLVLKNQLDTLHDADLERFVRQISPDLIVLDRTPFCRVMLALPYKLGIPFAFLGTYHEVINSRIPFTPSCNPQVFSDFEDRMPLLDRVQNSLIHLSLLYFNFFCDEDIVSKNVPEMPPITVSELSIKAEIFIVETDHILDYSRPMLPNTKLIGGTAAKPPKDLKEPFKSFADGAIDGLLLVSFGSFDLKIPEEITHKLLQAFAQINLKVIWRNSLTYHDSSRIQTSNWIPQNDILGHKNTRAFLSHCGTNGQYEALYNAIPMLCMPIYADQPHNARRIVRKGYGLRADIRYDTMDDLVRKIKDVAFNETYKNNIQTASNIFRQLYKSPVHEAAFWLDHVMQYGGAYMRFAGQKMPLYEFMLLDVVAVICGVSLVCLLLSFVCIWYTCRICCRCLKTKRKIE